MTDTVHPLDQIASEAAVAMTVCERSIFLDFAVLPELYATGHLNSLFERPGYSIKEVPSFTCAQYYIECQEHINIAKVVAFIVNELEGAGLGLSIIVRYAESGMIWANTI
jgi:hypothetical protein